MRRAGRAAAEVLAEVGAAVRPGVTTDELDRIAHDGCIARGGYPSPLNYGGAGTPFPKSLCTSVNEVICHGIPDSTVLKDGDIVNCDVTIYLDGVHGDTNRTFLVGDVDEQSRRLVEVTQECLDLGIAAVRPGAQVRDIGKAIQEHAEGLGYGVVRAFVGHGVGRSFHCEPQVFHYDNPQATQVLEGRDDVHHRADDHHRRLAARDVGRRLDRGHGRPLAHRAVRAHAAGHRRRRRGLTAIP
jgi:methionyl aminopeptidase